MNCPQCGYHIDTDEDSDLRVNEDPETEKIWSAWWSWCTKTVVAVYTPGLFDWWKTKYQAGEDPKLEDIPADILLPHIKEKILASDIYRRQQIIAKLNAVNGSG